MKRFVVLLTILVATLVVALWWFYRKPPQILWPHESAQIVRSACYGRVLRSSYNHSDNTYLVSVFLALDDIHWQTNPVNGQVIDVRYDPTGQFNIAYDYNKSRDNEKSITTYQTPRGRVYLYQIAGLMARRISTYVKPGMQVVKGDIMGLIKFGSRVDLIIENGDRFHPDVRAGDYVKGSQTIIGRWTN